MADRSVLLEQLKHHNSFYLYEESVILDSIAQLKGNFPGAQFLYSMKTNPYNRVLDTVFAQGFGTDAASLGEVIASEEHGVPAELIYFSAPARTEADLRAAYGRCVLIADSLREVETIAKIGAEKGEIPEIGVRINPDFTFAADHGVPVKFGIDEEALWNADLSGVKLVGIHVHAKSQELSAEILANYYKNMFALIGRVQEKLGVSLRFVNFGSGLGIPFVKGDEPLDVEYLGRKFQEMRDACKAQWPDLQILIETGRYTVGRSGTYVMKVIDKKVSYGKTFLLLNNTLNGYSRPAVSLMAHGFTANPAPYEPLYMAIDEESYTVLSDNEDLETVTIGGCLCTSADIIAKDVSLPRMEIGDGLALANAGCYAAVMTPMQFAFLQPPAQLFLTCDGKVLKT